MSTINVRNFPDDLHRSAKAAAAKEGKTLQDWFIEAVKEKLEREKESK
jgi:predicted HicB family RNase H-like nuclease